MRSNGSEGAGQGVSDVAAAESEAAGEVEQVGPFRIYLGAAPGVGKTYAMLSEGHRRRGRGTDVVVGFVESYGRPHTEELVNGLEVIPRKVVDYRGKRLEEMDLDAVLRRRPEVALVDELAHTNVPGSGRHEKRWQDVLDMSPAGGLLAALLGAFAAPYIGWRGLFAVGLLPALLTLYIRAFVPESPHWLLRRGRVEEARKSLAWALQMDPAQISLPAAVPAVEHTRWLELFKYPRSIVAGCLTGLTQTGGVALALWQVTLFVMVLNITPARGFQAGDLAQYRGDRRPVFRLGGSPTRGGVAPRHLPCLIAAVFMSLAGYLHDVFIGGASMFFVRH